jgi:starch synthase
MNVVINDIDRPLVIKVASISAARMQVYFIDNDDYFHREQIFENEEGQFFEDNDERAIFFARGILETVKKLRWKPDIIHCNGWISHLVPLFLKKAYKNDPIFTDAKVVVSIYDEYMNEAFDSEMKNKISMPGIKPKDMELLNEPNGINLAKLALQYSDGLIKGVESINPEVEEFAKAQGLPILEYVEQVQPSGEYIDRYNEFYDKILDEVR